MLQKEGQVRIPAGCAISGIFHKDGTRENGTRIIDSIRTMHDRSNGLGGGFAGYGIYPEYADYYAFHVFFDTQAAKDECERDKDGNLVPNMTPQLELNVPIMFSAMSYGSISYNAHASLARAACALGTYYNTGEGGLHKDFYQYGPHTIVQVASGRVGVHKDYLEAGSAIEI